MNSEELVKELRKLTHRMRHRAHRHFTVGDLGSITEIREAVLTLISGHESKAVEPLELEELGKLGKRKGYKGVLFCLYTDGWKLVIWRTYKEIGTTIIVAPDTDSRQVAEGKAKAYLQGLPDVEKK
jgi:hypothetical protein